MCIHLSSVPFHENGIAAAQDSHEILQLLSPSPCTEPGQLEQCMDTIVVPHLMGMTWERHVHDVSFHVVETTTPY